MTDAESAQTPPEEKKQKNKKTHEDAPNVYQRIVEAQRVIDGMEWAKDMSNAQYKSIPIDRMRAGVRKACIRAGLVHVGPLDLRYDVQMKDGRIKVYTGTCIFRYINADDPEDSVDFPSMGEAMDTGDKGAGKLISNLIKTHYKTMFDIGEQGRDDIDSYANEDIEAEADRIAERRAKRFEAMRQDPFFGKPDPLADLRRRIGPLVRDHAETIMRFKKEHGNVPEWDEETLKACIAECGGDAE